MEYLNCSLGKNHIAKLPKQLPCGSIYCLECLKAIIDSNGKFICSCCKEEHTVDSLDNVPDALNFHNILTENAEKLVVKMNNELNNAIVNIKGNKT